jgi:hypothetical protein
MLVVIHIFKGAVMFVQQIQVARWLFSPVSRRIHITGDALRHRPADNVHDLIAWQQQKWFTDQLHCLHNTVMWIIFGWQCRLEKTDGAKKFVLRTML